MLSKQDMVGSDLGWLDVMTLVGQPPDHRRAVYR
jgi:hypothetical protein